MQALEALYLRLLANTHFKAAFADAFARHYDLIARHFMASSWDDGLVFSRQISVQFFNRPGIVVPLVHDPEVALLRRMLTLTSRLIRSMSRDPAAAADSLLDRKRRRRSCTTCASCSRCREPRSPRSWLADRALVQAWGGFLATLDSTRSG